MVVLELLNQLYRSLDGWIFQNSSASLKLLRLRNFATETEWGKENKKAMLFISEKLTVTASWFLPFSPFFFFHFSLILLPATEASEKMDEIGLCHKITAELKSDKKENGQKIGGARLVGNSHLIHQHKCCSSFFFPG